MPVTDPLFYLCAIPAVVLTGISKGGFAGALGSVAVPLMALAVSPVQAAAVMLPLLCLMDWTGLRIYWRKWDVPNLRIILAGGLVGVGLGTLAFGVLSEATIRLAVGAISVLFALNAWFGLAARQGPAGRSPVKGWFWSGVSGFTSFLAHAGGPPIMAYMLPQRLDKAIYVGTVNTFFLVINAVKLVPYASLGQFSADNLLTSLVLAPLVPAGVWLGAWLNGRVSPLLFYRIVQAGMFVTGLQLMWQGWPG